MDETIIYPIIAIVSLLIGVFAGRIVLKKAYKQEELKTKEKAELLIKEAEISSENLKKNKILEAKEKFLKLKAEFEEEANRKKNQIISNENKLKQREQNFSKQIEKMKRREAELESSTENLNAQLEIIAKRKEEMEKVKKIMQKCLIFII